MAKRHADSCGAIRPLCGSEDMHPILSNTTAVSQAGVDPGLNA